MDNFIFHKLPERLVNRSFASTTPSISEGNMVSSHPSDAYSAIINELEQDIDSRTHFSPPSPPDIEDDD